MTQALLHRPGCTDDLTTSRPSGGNVSGDEAVSHVAGAHYRLFRSSEAGGLPTRNTSWSAIARAVLWYIRGVDDPEPAGGKAVSPQGERRTVYR